VLTPFLVAITGSPVKVGRALLEFREVLDRLQTALRAEQSLDIDAAQRCGLYPAPELLRADIADQVESGVGVAIGVTVETRDAAARVRGSPVLGLIKLLLRERREEQAQTFELLRIQDAVEQLIIILDGDELSLRHIAEIRPRGQVNRRREFGQKVVLQVEVEVETGQVAIFLFLDFVDRELWEYHAAFRMVGMGQRQESLREDIAGRDFIGTQRGEFLPGHSGGQLDANATLNRFPSRHRDALRRVITQVITLLEQRLMALHDVRLRG
jgi:hypothetical protein